MRDISTIADAALALMLSSISFAQQAGQFGTADEAKAMLMKAVAAVKADKAKALDMFAKGEGGFKDRDLYVFCFNMADGKFSAHTNPALIGTDTRALKDGDDPLGQRGYDLVKGLSEGAVGTNDYRFPKPGTTEPVPKESFMTRVEGQGCGVGYYK